MDQAIDWPDFNTIPTSQYGAHRGELLLAFEAVRAHSEFLTHPFTEAEQQVQSMPDASPTKWHLAHTTWFFETFILNKFKPGFDWFDRDFCFLFNSYYNAIGAQFPRPKRGMISKPDLDGVWDYRRKIDADMRELLENTGDREFLQLAPVLVLGLNHEQQHQELMLTDIKHARFQATMGPDPTPCREPEPADQPREWLDCQGGIVEVGYSGRGFCFDNELASHEALIPPFRLASGLVTAGEWMEFIADGGYATPLLWLADGWHWQKENGVCAPLYWTNFDGNWLQFRTGGWSEIDPAQPVRHISYYEADAFAAWAGKRLPRETEWECAAKQIGESSLTQDGLCWEWTQSAYGAYPGFQPTTGDAAEYNGKFMVNQMVLRGSSTATPRGHSRPSYRNFFYPTARWQFSGLRLAGGD